MGGGYITRSKIFAVTSKVSTVLGALLSVIYLATQEYAQAILWSRFFCSDWDSGSISEVQTPCERQIGWALCFRLWASH